MQKGQTCLQNLAQIMGWNVGGHPHGNAVGAIDQQIWKACGKYRWFFFLVVVIGLEGNSFKTQIVKQCIGNLFHTHFCVAHGCRWVAVNGTKIALPLNQWQAHGKVLGHAHQSVIDSAVTMGVVFTDHVANHTGGLSVRFVKTVACFLHGKQNPPMHRLQTISNVGNGPRHDHAHGIIEVGFFHLCFDENLTYSPFFRLFSHKIVIKVRQYPPPHMVFAISPAS